MAFRVPLVPKNVDTKSKANEKSKKQHSLVPPTMDRSNLLESLKRINDNFASPAFQTRVYEEDVIKPSVSKSRRSLSITSFF